MKSPHCKSLSASLTMALATIFLISGSKAQTTGLKADLRSSSAVLTPPVAGGVLPTALAGGVVVGTQTWVCDASVGFAPVNATETGVADPFLAVGVIGAIKLPVSPTTVPATCGQSAAASDGFTYVTQGVVDTRNTPSTARGVLRVALDPTTGLSQGVEDYIATTAGLDGNQPTAVAMGPDGNLYVGFLKNGNVKRIINPGSGITQVVQSVGNTPQGHPARAFAFVGNALFIASVDAFSVILNATSASCTGGCNAVALTDGFPGVVHSGMTSNGTDAVYFSVAAPFTGGNQVWRYSLSTGLYTFVSQGGVDKNGANASNFSFDSAKTNLLALDPSGNLWIGDDTSGTGATGAGRLWSIGAAALAGLPAGSQTAGTDLAAILNVLHGPWQVGIINNREFVVNFNTDGTFTATFSPTNSGPVAATSGTWTLTPPLTPPQFSNPRGRLTLIGSDGTVLISGDYYLVNADLLGTDGPVSGSLGAFLNPWVKLAA